MICIAGKKARDLRNWLTIYSYWNQGGMENVAWMEHAEKSTGRFVAVLRYLWAPVRLVLQLLPVHSSPLALYLALFLPIESRRH